MISEQPDVAALEGLLVDAQDRLGHGAYVERFDIVASWERVRSGSTFFRMVGFPHGPDVVVKMSRRWQPGEAEQHYGTLTLLHEILSSGPQSGAQAIPPLTWIDDPPLIVMPYVEGADVITMMRETESAVWKEDGALLSRWMMAAGSALATYHAAMPRPGDGEQASRDVLDVARRTRMSRLVVRLIDGLRWAEITVGAFGDFGPGNLHGTPDGEVYLVDPPDAGSTAVIHRDLGNFLFELRRQLAGRGFTRTAALPDVFDDLRRAFLGAYAEAAGIGALKSSDYGLIALFEMRRALGMARKRLVVRPADAVWFARSALGRRRELIRLATHGPV